MIDHFIYDFDGTISDSYPIFFRIVKEIIARHGGKQTCDDDALYRRLKLWVADGYHAVEWEDGFTKKDFFDEFHMFQKQYFDRFLLYRNAENLLRETVEAGKKNYLYTHSGEVVHQIMEHMGISKYFTYVIDSSHGFPPKPAPDALLHLIERYHLDPKTCVMVGDRPVDVQAGENAGMQSCFFDPDGFYPNTPATYHVDDLIEILNLTK